MTSHQEKVEGVELHVELVDACFRLTQIVRCHWQVPALNCLNHRQVTVLPLASRRLQEQTAVAVPPVSSWSFLLLLVLGHDLLHHAWP